MRQAVAAIRSHDHRVDAVSALYLTEPVGGGRQPVFLNAVLRVACAETPLRWLVLAKRLERQAGRRRGPIDIDILDMGGRVLGRANRRTRTPIVLPHPELHRRRFMLIPLLDVAPHWHHPVLDRSARQILAALPRQSGAVHRLLDSSWVSCDEDRLSSIGDPSHWVPLRLLSVSGQ
jgi:2-amino-4-hydroxy-6-hydroxymethyldihydropteridine diphosphokinase